jgi:pyrroloquinoline quinone biosynthesis protein D
MQQDAVPSFARGVRFRFDKVRDAWVLLAPERLFLLDEQGAAILELVDGQRSLAVMADLLAERYGAPAELVARDAGAMLDELAGKGLIRS